MKARVFKLPNSIILNANNLHPSAIGVALVLYANMDKHRKFTNSLENIAAMSFKCKDTVRQAIEELETAGYIKKTQKYVQKERFGRIVYDRATYCIVNPVEYDYTLIPYTWLYHELTPCTLQVLLVCRMFMIKEKERSFPSLRRIAKLIRISKSTVCNALASIAELGILLVEHCMKRNEGFTSNSYYMIHHKSITRTYPLTMESITQNILEAFLLPKTVHRCMSST